MAKRPKAREEITDKSKNRKKIIGNAGNRDKFRFALDFFASVGFSRVEKLSNAMEASKLFLALVAFAAGK